MLMPGGQSQFDRQAVRVDHGMDLGGQPTSGSAKFFVGAMLDACGVLMRPDNRAVDHLNLCIFAMRDGSQDAVPDARTSPPHEPVVAGRVGAVSLWQIPPRCSRPQDPEDAIQDPSVVHTRDASRLAGQDRFDETPLGVSEGIAHSDCSFSELESRRQAFVQCLLRRRDQTLRAAA